jgi:peptidoglycan/xylan/chitin deacetylase (PgdA/CDA1 family)
VGRRGTTAIAAIALGLAVVGERAATAGDWPRPAAGGSASGAPEVLFTFDDGPDEDLTPRILDELDRRGIQAIFFWVGRRVVGDGPGAVERRAVVERAIRTGHLIGNHTVNHAQLCHGSAEAAAQEIDRNAALYAPLTRLPGTLFRSPYGARCRRLVAQLEARGLEHVHWDVDPQEFLSHDGDETARKVIAKLRHLEGRAVILMHDTKRATVRALPQVLDWIDAENARRRARGAPAIRVVSGSSWLAERLDPGLVAWARQGADDLPRAWREALRRLVPYAGGGDVVPDRAARLAPP